MQLNSSELKQLQAVLLTLLIEFDRICRKNNIEYSLSGGTLIGAVREQGFIPWDDDADIAITREEYNKFVQACAEDLDKEKFFLQDHNSDPEYPWYYSKLRMNGTKLVQTGQEDMKFHNGIFLDIFIYDHVPDGFVARRLHFIKCFLIRKCQYSAVGRKNAKSLFLRMLYSLLNLIPKNWLFAQLDRMAEKNNSRDTELSRYMTYPYFRKESRYGIPTRCFEEYIDADFEGKKFMIIKDYDMALTLKYGNYMIPPPKDEIIFYPVSEIRFPENNSADSL